MYNENELLNFEHIIESVLFMMGESVPVDLLATAIDLSIDDTKQICDLIVEKYKTTQSNRGFKIVKINSKYQMVTNELYYNNLIKVASQQKKPVLTDSLLETLSIIAYKQPITKPEIEDIRGVKSDFACNRLIEYGLIEEKGRLEAPGRPILLGTTEEFLYRFGIESNENLPKLDEQQISKIEKEVEKELSTTLGEPVIIDKNISNNNDNDNINNTIDEILNPI